MSALERLVLRLRPAPLASAVADLFRLSDRRFVTTGGATFFVNPISEFGLAVRRGDHEPEMIAVLKRHLGPGSVFLDLGANEGYFSVIASHLVGPSGRVVAVEPQSRLQNVLLTNFKANNCENIRIMRLAVFSRNQNVQLKMASERNTGSTSLYQTTRYPQPEEEVAGVTLGQLMEQAEIAQCDLLKVDIEGAEYDALMGAEEVLKRGCIRHIAVEYHDAILQRRGASRREIHDLITGCGYGASELLNLEVYSYEGN